MMRRHLRLSFLFVLPFLACNLTAVPEHTTNNSPVVVIPTVVSAHNDPLPTAATELVIPAMATTAITSTATAVASNPTLAASATPVCKVQQAWPVYMVQAGDTLFNIGRHVGLTVAELAAANCLADVQLIVIGQPLHVPVEIVPTATAVSPQLLSFNVIPRTVNSNEPTVISWESSGTQAVYLYTRHSLVSFGGEFLNNGRPLPPTGSFTTTAPLPLSRISYGIGFQADESRLLTDVTVHINCIYDFFVDPGHIEACPTTDVQIREAAYQPFERGFMVWQPGKNWVFSNDTPSNNELMDTWQGEPIEFDEEPPEGLFLPQRGFGKVWVENEWIQRALGWATAVEQSYKMEYQETATGTGVIHYFIGLPDGRYLHVMLFHGTSLSWQPTTRR